MYYAIWFVCWIAIIITAVITQLSLQEHITQLSLQEHINRVGLKLDLAQSKIEEMLVDDEQSKQRYRERQIELKREIAARRAR